MQNLIQRPEWRREPGTPSPGDRGAQEVGAENPQRPRSSPLGLWGLQLYTRYSLCLLGALRFLLTSVLGAV